VFLSCDGNGTLPSRHSCRYSTGGTARACA
jgi:hypothetical protein